MDQNIDLFSNIQRKNYQDFFPNSYILNLNNWRYSGDELEFLKIQQDEKCEFQRKQKKNNIWILKPCYENRGRGIEIITNLTEFQKDSKDSHIIQQYLEQPLLIEGKKFDIRCYVLIASTQPYFVLYHDGYIRKCINDYKKPSKDNKDLVSQLTNQAVQYGHSDYKKVKEETVWTMEQFNDYCKNNFCLLNQNGQIEKNQNKEDVKSENQQQSKKIVVNSGISTKQNSTISEFYKESQQQQATINQELTKFSQQDEKLKNKETHQLKTINLLNLDLQQQKCNSNDEDYLGFSPQNCIYQNEQKMDFDTVQNSIIQKKKKKINQDTQQKTDIKCGDDNKNVVQQIKYNRKSLGKLKKQSQKELKGLQIQPIKQENDQIKNNNYQQLNQKNLDLDQQIVNRHGSIVKQFFSKSQQGFFKKEEKNGKLIQNQRKLTKKDLFVSNENKQKDKIIDDLKKFSQNFYNKQKEQQMPQKNIKQIVKEQILDDKKEDKISQKNEKNCALQQEVEKKLKIKQKLQKKQNRNDKKKKFTFFKETFSSQQKANQGSGNNSRENSPISQTNQKMKKMQINMQLLIICIFQIINFKKFKFD
ncbi:hypothetical protein PPERSA_12723 [Pseudocohnilembus persalinus]|uniref:Tubulin-tyrosine ligase family protein n=1 Tax=Pseudocohnilembus persalinus TaxID=266149 RepID=A0A0V0QT40_PSEPJ|nr:hypothetical protein PPERSA_12723 [Pseudocohnilembus persalinus]|eukprot:KRX05545.1 hypothetical protein PPERSA_12723 [Pseudocohnilembus persalinus]